ncbi:hypothetical protein NMS_2105 [Nonlabens marinus S1-08]|uniref:Uncharacterized protein n=1 Tax=Nonlabens marinus S1-08 TaxID=1454201 RepID=W8VR71_9FLAO|nr:hypothetical protein NMS_2105 [Nonlabens marinus S1-08]
MNEISFQGAQTVFQTTLVDDVRGVWIESGGEVCHGGMFVIVV